MIWNREPALIYGLAQALLTLAVVFGLDLTDEQTAAILAATSTLLALIVRSKVTPV
jgi:hypothetical protein